jgi:hypothetical protein
MRIVREHTNTIPTSMRSLTGNRTDALLLNSIIILTHKIFECSKDRNVRNVLFRYVNSPIIFKINSTYLLTPIYKRIAWERGCPIYMPHGIAARHCRTALPHGIAAPPPPPACRLGRVNISKTIRTIYVPKQDVSITSDVVLRP